MSHSADKRRLLLVDAGVLPEVFEKVVEGKRFLQTGQAKTAAQAAQLAGISRSAFYKYKDAVFLYDTQQPRGILTIHTELLDQPGVLSSLLIAFADAGANVLTVFQDIPSNGAATVSISARTDRMALSPEQLLRSLEQLPGIVRISRVSHDPLP